MSSTDKLLRKLDSRTITMQETETLLNRLGWFKKRQKGSHQVWSNGTQILVLSPNGKELMPYQIKQIAKALGMEKK